MFETSKLPTEQRTVTGNSVSFNTHYALPLDACKVSFSATESGTGEKSPSNPYTISGVSGLNLSANSIPVSINFGDTYYGGELDVLTGVLTATHYIPDLSNATIRSGNKATGYTGVYFYLAASFVRQLPPCKYSVTQNQSIKDSELFNQGVIMNPYTYDGNSAWAYKEDTGTNIRFTFTDIQTVEDFETIKSSLKVVYELEMPITIQLSASELSSILGNNTFSTDTGSLEISFQDLQEKSASGAVATFNTALAMPLASCNIAVNAWQEGSGDPSPDNVRAIHGFSEVNVTRCGINLWDGLWENGQFNWNTGIPSPRTDAIRSVNFILIKPNTNYYIYNNLTSNDLRFVFYDRNKEFISASGWFPVRGNNVITTPANAFYMKLCRVAVTSYDNTISVNYPSTDTAYHAYTGNTYTIQLGQEVYGAEVDVVNGVAHVNKGYRLFDGSEDEEWENYPTYSGFSISVPNLTTEIGSRDTISNLMKARTGASADYPAYRLALKIYILGITNNISGVTDLASWRTWLSNNNLEIVYPLAEPFDIQLTPTQIETLIGNNTIFADTGDIDLTYKDCDIAKRGDFRQVFKIPD